MFVKMFSLAQIVEGFKHWYYLVKWNFIWPLAKALLGDGVGRFEWRITDTNPYGEHEGVDIGDWVDYEKELVAPGSGVVTHAGLCGGYGYMLEIDFGFNVFTRMRGRLGHMRRIDVKVGERVKKGQVVGLCGGKPGDPGAGNTTAPHVHFELGIMSKNGRFVRLDPTPMMPKLVRGRTP